MSDRPNIIFFFTDQQRWDTCGCYGQPLDITPNLDQMAAEGVRFEKSFTCQPVCGPARACLQTGKFPTEIGCFTNHKLLPVNEPTIARQFSQSGYEVGYIGKWHLSSTGPFDGPDNFRTKPVPLERRGGYVDFWLAADTLEFTSHAYDGHMFDADGNQRDFPEGRYRVDAQTDWVLEYLQTRTGDKPFFLFISYIEPHHQNDHEHFQGPHGSKEKYKDFPVPGDLEGTEGDWRGEFSDYLGQCASLDENLGRIRDELSRLGLADDTLIVFTSDHGCHFRTRNEEYKRSCHESSIRVPLVICGLGFSGGKVIHPLVSLIDLPPTLLEAGGIQPPEFMRGRCLQELLAGTPADWPEEVFVQISEDQLGRAIRTERWKYSVRAFDKDGNKESSSDSYTEEFLYDLHPDPHERNNLVTDPTLAEVRAELAERLIARIVAAGQAAPEIKPQG